MPAFPVFGIPTVLLSNIGGILIDAILREDTTYDNDITENPLEDGTVATDNIINLPIKLNISGRITDTPFIVNRVASAAFYAARGEVPNNFSIASSVLPILPGGAESAFQELVRLRERKSVFKVTMGLRSFSNMGVKSLGNPRISKDGRSVRFNMVLQQILITDTVVIPASLVSEDTRHTATDQADVGLQATIIT